ncbi:hypothetical protein [Microbacterium sp. NPDC055683]
MMRRLALAVVPAALVLAAAGCASGGLGPAPAETSSVPVTAETGAPVTPTPVTTAPAASTPTAEPSDGIALPAGCEQVWSPEALAILSEDVGPLNDPGLTMLSTEVVPALEVLDTVPSLRCTWGLPSDVGIATTVAIIDDAQADAVLAALQERSFSCEDRVVVTRCELRETFDGAPAGEGGEIHVLGGNGWVSTHWLNADVEPEYTDDVIATLWG